MYCRQYSNINMCIINKVNSYDRHKDNKALI